ncbi:MAG: amidohydrolase family protein [Bifidobacteriaceae bacterium]|nr:amidohydrolase family protein [Bifidobacteriaceae bacterium]
MTNSLREQVSELWAIRGAALLPVDLGRGGLVASAHDSVDVALVLAPDAVVVVRGDRIVEAGDHAEVVRRHSAGHDSAGRRPIRAMVADDADACGGAGVAQGCGATAAPDRAVAVAAATARRWDGLILPGLVDIHCHGGGGQSFPDATTEAAAEAAVFEHRRHGTTSLVASLVTDTTERLMSQSQLLAGLGQRSLLEGIHFEGPFLSARRAGAQDPGKMALPDPALVLAARRHSQGWLATMTLAPELPNAIMPAAPDASAEQQDRAEDAAPAQLDAPAVDSMAVRPRHMSVVDALAMIGAVPSFGHTDCSAEQMAAAVDQAHAAFARYGAPGRRPTATHLFNGMRPIHHRDPGPAMEALAQAAAGRMVVELVADGVHLAPQLVKEVFELVGWPGIALVTDAMAAAGMPDGEYQLGPAAVRVSGGVARLADADSIAGGTAHLIDVVRCVTRASGVALEAAVAAASLTPARVLGRSDRIGSLAPGRRADLILADADLSPVEVYAAGARVPASAAASDPDPDHGARSAAD